MLFPDTLVSPFLMLPKLLVGVWVSLGEGEGEEMLSINFDGGSKPINLYCRMGAGDSRVTFLGIFILSIG